MTKKIFAFDIESITDMSIGPRIYSGKDRIFAYVWCDWEGECEVVRLPERNIGVVYQPLQKRLHEIDEIICHNAKFEREMLITEGYEIPSRLVWHDTMIQSQLLHNLRPHHSLDAVAWELCGWDRSLDTRVHRAARMLGGFHRVPVELMDAYQITDGQRAMLLHRAQFPAIAQDPKLLADYENEIALIAETGRMERQGIYLRQRDAEDLQVSCEELAAEAEQEMYAIVGERINIGSPEQVRYLLYSSLKLPILLYTKSGFASTDKVVMDLLEKLPDIPQRAKDALRTLRKFRSYAKGAGIIRGYQKLAENSIIHPNIMTNQAATGREACAAPNLQNVSKESKGEFGIAARKCFGPRPGRIWWSIDQSGIELRLIIEAAQCRQMMDELRAGKHPHITFCEIFYGDAWKGKKLTKPLYDSGKNGHFALGYGAAVPKIATTCGISLTQAQRAYAEYCHRYPQIAHLVRDGLKQVKQSKKIVTSFGRTLQIPHQEIYAWLNYFIQGTAAGIIKRGQVAVGKSLRAAGIPAAPVLAIHDEIIFEGDPYVLKHEQDFLKLVRSAMIDMPDIKVPLETEAKRAVRRWSEAQEVPIIL